MPRLSVTIRKRVIILRRQGYSLSEIRNRLDEEDIDEPSAIVREVR